MADLEEVEIEEEGRKRKGVMAPLDQAAGLYEIRFEDGSTILFHKEPETQQ